MPAALRIFAHILLFITVAFVFFLGLGVGLLLNPTLGTLLWLTAAAIAGVNVAWPVRSRR
ncbi:MAG: hypothetical protein OXK21_07995 [Chloroflexota bacterium]|nr:hypothetical protein [Chloroflexota bacterium]